MYYKKSKLRKSFQKIIQNRTEEQFIADTVNSFLHTWLANERGQGEYKQVGGYWEVLYPIFIRVAPEKIKVYENLLGEFEVFNPQVKKIFDEGSDLYNLIGALLYVKERQAGYALPGDVHLIDLGNDEIIPYIPNQSIDAHDYWGRED